MSSDLDCPVCGDGDCEGCPRCDPPCPYCDRDICPDPLTCEQNLAYFRASIVASTADTSKAWRKGEEAGEPPF